MIYTVIWLELCLLGFITICKAIHKLMILCCITTFFVEWKLLEERNEEYWYGFIPFYNMYKLCEIVFGKDKGWYCIWLFLPITSWIMYPIFCNELRKQYNYEPMFLVGLLFLPFIFLPILVFDKQNIEMRQTETETKETDHISKMAHWKNEEVKEEVDFETEIKDQPEEEITEEQETVERVVEEIVEQKDVEKIQEKMNEENA